jgi:hypothetical protein
MRWTHSDAEKRYDKIREITIFAAQKRLVLRPEYADIILDTITGDALRQAKEWARSPKRRVHWDWYEGYSDFRFRHPKRFELAIWQRGVLISLTLGRPTYNGTALRLDFIEANPDNLAEVRVFPIALFAMLGYAEALGATEIRVMNPVNDAVKKYYADAGLVYVAKGDYLSMRL